MVYGLSGIENKKINKKKITMACKTSLNMRSQEKNALKIFTRKQEKGIFGEPLPTTTTEKKQVTPPDWNKKDYINQLRQPYREHSYSRRPPRPRRQNQRTPFKPPERTPQSLEYTRPCKHVVENKKDDKYGVCYREKCTFAHSLDELKLAECSFGDNCMFIEEKLDFRTNRIKICMFKHPFETKDEYFRRTGKQIDLPKTALETRKPKQARPKRLSPRELEKVVVEETARVGREMQKEDNVTNGTGDDKVDAFVLDLNEESEDEQESEQDDEPEQEFEIVVHDDGTKSITVASDKVTQAFEFLKTQDMGGVEIHVNDEQ